MRILLGALGAVLLAIASAGALAAEQCEALSEDVRQSCACVFDIASAGGGPVALLSEIEGDVLKTDIGEYAPVTSTTGLNVGDGVLTKANGQATVSAGPECRLAVGPQMSVVITEIGGCGCVALVGDGQIDPTVTGSPGGGGLGLAALLAAAAGGGIALAISP